MSFGQDYARTYDSFYREKDYARETQFALDRLQKVTAAKNLRILDIGCGTGLHDVYLATAGHTVKGLDTSAGMLALAEDRRAGLPADVRNRLSFQAGDARILRLGNSFDAVVSLFHVMSYMAGDGDLDAALETVRAHLAPGGAFLFDFWYGPAVIANPPHARERSVDESGRHIRRMTTAHWEPERDIARIVFDVEETNLTTGTKTKLSEEHIMRYYFEDGLHKSLAAHGFEVLDFGEWLTGLAPTTSTFGVYALARAV